MLEQLIKIIDNKDNLELLDGTKVSLESQEFSAGIGSKRICICGVKDKETGSDYLIPVTLIKGFDIKLQKD